MSLNLDERQRAMLQEMGIPVWLPRPAVAVAVAPVVVPRITARPEARVLPSVVPAVPVTRAPLSPAAPVMRALVPTPTRAGPDAPPDWAALGDSVRACSACGLCLGRKAAVFSTEGVPRQADWLVVGEPPDELEERAGTPFAGQAGELLDNMLRALQLRRDGTGSNGARLTNVVKCRPGVARNPQTEELAACSAYLWREIELVQPRVILAMGRFAALSLLAETYPELLGQPFGKLRGTVYRVRGLPVVVTHHPARLLRAQADKALAWADLCLAQTAARQSGQLLDP